MCWTNYRHCPNPQRWFSRLTQPQKFCSRQTIGLLSLFKQRLKASQKEGAQHTALSHRSPSTPPQTWLLVTFRFTALWAPESAAEPAASNSRIHVSGLVCNM